MDKLSYALGMSMAANLIDSGFTNIDAESLTQAFTDCLVTGKPAISAQECQQLIQEYMSNRQNNIFQKNLEEGLNFLEENSKKEGVVTLASGLQYQILKDAEGEKPSAKDRVKCHYHGTLINGAVFDSSVERNQPAVFGVNQVIKGWVEALQLMAVGSKWRLFIPSDLAYGEQGAGKSIEPNSALIFDVELLGIEK